MNDNMVINTISKIHFIIVSFIFFIFLVLSSSFFILQNGFLAENISIQNVKIKKLYIKWDKKITLSIKNIELTKSDKDNNLTIELKDIQNYFSKIQLFNNWFKSIRINNIKYADYTASFSYIYGGNGLITIKSKNFLFNSSLFYKKNLFNIQINKLQDIKRKIKTTGNIILNNKNTEFTTSLFIDINNDLSVNLLAHSNKQKLFYRLNSYKNIKDVKYIINLLHLPKSLHYWARDAIVASSLSIKSAYGWLDYNDLKNGYKNLYIDATGNNLHYAYNPNLDAIHTKRTDLEFKNGIFFIRPREAYSYGMYLGTSWLKIDFTKKQELLTLHLLFDGKLNKDMLGILNTYKVKLPFLQKKGTIKTNLKLIVNLITIDITSKGEFFTKKANFDYLGLNLDIFDSTILLNNYDVKVNKMKVRYKDIAIGDVDFSYNAKRKIGDINFKLSKVEFKDISLKLQKPLNVIYKIRPSNDKIYIDKSYWAIKNNNIVLSKSIVPFNLDTLAVKIPKTFLKNDFISAYINGTVNLKSQKANITIKPLDNLNKKITFIYNKNIILTSQNKIKYRYKNIDLQLDSIIFNKKSNTIRFNNLSANHKKFGNLFIDKKFISFYIDLDTNKAYFKDLSIYLPSILDLTDETKNKTINHSLNSFHIEAKNSNIFITKNRKIITDKINIDFNNNNISADITHNKGKSKFTYRNKTFNLYGGNFDDLFMEKLFNNSDFKDGKFSFSIRGTKDNYAGELYLQDSTILKYKLLNNTLAFINTIPSLTTFSLPSFNKDGIYIKTSYIKFKQQNDEFNIYDTFLKSNELSIVGDGKINILKNKIDMELNLKSDIGINLSKVPLVGYIILNKDSLSTKVRLTGKLDNPTVKTVLTKDILIAPLNIIKRTLTLPLNIFNKDNDKTK